MNKQPTNEQVLMQVAQGFLQRADLKGGEVDSYAKCFNFLQTIVEGQNVVVPAKAFKDGMDALEKVCALDAASEGPEEDDTSGDENMVSEGGPLNELEDVE